MPIARGRRGVRQAKAPEDDERHSRILQEGQLLVQEDACEQDGERRVRRAEGPDDGDRSMHDRLEVEQPAQTVEQVGHEADRVEARGRRREEFRPLKQRVVRQVQHDLRHDEVKTEAGRRHF